MFFLLNDMISNGYQVIWLTHRHMLIDQTADAFYMLAPLAKSEKSNKMKLKMSCISGEHSTIKATEKDDDIMIISVQSVCRSLDYLKSVLAKKVFIVVDEAHHTVAASYRKTIDYIKELRKDAKLLGLTATPVRGTDSESKYLLKLFDHTIIYDISMGKLISKKILADPHFERIDTNIDFEPVISMDEAKLIKKYGEIPPTLADKIARSSKRNKVIVDTYIQNKERYGKTLIFTLNALHCYTLYKDLKEKGVNCDYVYSGNSDNEEKISRFKENKLDVLVNINILTEGSDVPDIQTIFLTRPTNSEGLLMQMIGRGMRGILARGTETVNIVDFFDQWGTFNKWLNPKWLIDKESKPPEVKDRSPIDEIKIPWDLISDIYKSISQNGSFQRTLMLPIGWYPLLDEEGNDRVMLVWKEQLTGLRQMFQDKKEIFAHNENTAEYVIRKHFGGFVTPPSYNDIELLLENWFTNGSAPHLFTFENRNQIDPVSVSNKLKAQNIGIADLESKVKEIYDCNTTMIENLFADFESYYSRIIDCIKYKGGMVPNYSDIVEIPIELLPFKVEPTHDLKMLTKEVIEEMFGGVYGGIEGVDWTDKTLSSYFGMYLNGFIRINKLLDSPQVDKEVVKFVIYHELLHRDYYRHDKAFYAEEHKYPNYTELNRFLDFKIHNYKFEM